MLVEVEKLSSPEVSPSRVMMLFSSILAEILFGAGVVTSIRLSTIGEYDLSAEVSVIRFFLAALPTPLM